MTTMNGSDSSATATLTATARIAVVTATSPVADEEEEDPAALTLDSADMDLVNGPNPWLPAYGFQLQHHSHFQPTHLEDLRANGSYVIALIFSLFLLSALFFFFSFFFFILFFLLCFFTLIAFNTTITKITCFNDSAIKKQYINYIY